MSRGLGDVYKRQGEEPTTGAERTALSYFESAPAMAEGYVIAAEHQDELLTIKAFGSTDVGISFLIETEGRRIFHAGDLNNWHWKDESTPQEVAEAEGNYLKELDIIAKETSVMDLVMFPVDPRLGTDFMRGAQQFIDRIKTSVFVPMHFWERPAEVMAFGPYAESKGCRYIVLSVPGEGTDI